MTCTTASAAERIRALNDDFRRTFVGGAVMITAGVEAMPLINVARSSRRSAPSTPSPTTTIPMASTTSARSTKAVSATSGKSIITTATPSSARLIPLIPPSRRAS